MVQVFANIVATRQYAQAPSSKVLCDDDAGDDSNHNANIDEPNLEEDDGNYKEDGILNFMDDICNIVGSNTRICGKRK